MTIPQIASPEIKAHTAASAPVSATAGPSSLDVVAAFDEFMQAFEAFKQTNDERLDQLENRISADSLTVEKMDRIEQSLDRQKSRMDALVLKEQRPALAGAGAALLSGVALEHKQAFGGYVRHGREDNLRILEAKALSVVSDPNGGYLVPDELEHEIARQLATVSPIRSIANVAQVTGSTYKLPFATTGAYAGWVSETATRLETASPSLSQLEFPTHELYAMPAATQTLLEDAAANVDDWIVQEMQDSFAELEGTAFVNGTGVRQPKGFLSYPTEDDASWSWGRFGRINTGVNGDFAATAPFDSFIELAYALPAAYRQNATWVMNRKVQSQVRRFKDADGNYIWQPPTGPGAQASILNFPLKEVEDMPGIGTNSLSIAFGDFKRGYQIVDRRGLSVLRDPYSRKPYVLFYVTKRVGGGARDFAAIKFLRFGT